MIGGPVREFVRLQRFEIRAVLLGAGVLGAIGMAATYALGSIQPDSDEFAVVNTVVAGPFMAAMAIFPFASGILLGGPIVAAEVERSTGALSWSLAESRVRWLASRSLPPALVLLTSLTVLSIVAETLEAARAPTFDPAVSFLDFGLRGPLVVAKGCVGFGIGLLAGATTGRVLRAFVLAGSVTVVLVNATGFAMARWIPEVVIESGRCAQTCIGLQDGVLAADGRILSLTNAARTAPTGPPPPGGPSSEAMTQWLAENGYTTVSVGIPGDRMPEVRARELVVLLAVAGATLCGAGLVTARRGVK
jgi:hypothetical protein